MVLKRSLPVDPVAAVYGGGGPRGVTRRGTSSRTQPGYVFGGAGRIIGQSSGADRRDNRGMLPANIPIPKRLPKLDPRILNPPVILPKEPKGILDVIIDLIKPKSGLKKVTANEDDMAHIFGLPHSIGEAATSILGAAATSYFQPTAQVTGFSPLDSSYDLAQQAGNFFMGETLTPTTTTEVTIDNATGKCIALRKKKSRKRRRRLATLSDIKDLAALKQVLGGGKAFDTWIATRGR